MVKMIDDTQRASCLAFLRFWLCSIRLHAFGAAVLLVGTHGDVVSERWQHEAIDAHLWSEFGVENARNGNGALFGLGEGALRLEHNDEDKLCFFPVDNTARPPPPIVGRLKAAVDRIIAAEEFVQREIPLSWLDLQDALQARAETDGVVHRSEVEALAAGMPEAELESALKLLHSLGVVIYFPEPGLREWVTLDPQFLVDQISAVVRDYDLHTLRHDKDARAMAAEWKALVSEGVVSEKLLRVLWRDVEAQRPLLTALLQKLDLACPLPGNPTRYLVPSALPHKRALSQRPSLPPLMGSAPHGILKGSAPDGAAQHRCTLRFALVVTTGSAIGFAPEALWARLLVKCSQYASILRSEEAAAAGGAAAPLDELRSDWARLAFGAQVFELRREDASIEVALWLAYPTPVVVQLLHLASEVCDEWMPEMTCAVTVTVKGEEFDLTKAIDALETRGVVRHPTRLSGGELRRADFAPWVLPETEAWYDVFISYRQVIMHVIMIAIMLAIRPDVFISYRQASESALANLLFTTLSGKTVGRDGQHVRAFLNQIPDCVPD
jgi:hypothetical protein